MDDLIKYLTTLGQEQRGILIDKIKDKFCIHCYSIQSEDNYSRCRCTDAD